MRHTTLSFGVMPTFEQFDAAFRLECPRGLYRITPGWGQEGAVVEAAGEHTAAELYALVDRLREDQPEDADDMVAYERCGASLASCIMETLGFEWV